MISDLMHSMYVSMKRVRKMIHNFRVEYGKTVDKMFEHKLLKSTPVYSDKIFCQI